MTTSSVPTMMVIGAGKAGTTTLHAMLNTLSQVYMSSPKEIQYFSHPRHPDFPLSWYHGFFEEGRNLKHRGESSPVYTMFPAIRGVAQRIHEMNPDIRLVYIVREPVARMVSAYAQARWDGRDYRPIEEALMWDMRYIAPSMYAAQLNEYLRWFDLEQIHVEDVRDLRSDPMGVLARASEFLEVPCDGHEVQWKNQARGRSVRRGYAPVLHHLRARGLDRGRWQRRLRASWVGSASIPPEHLTISRELETDMRSFFRDDIANLEQLLSRSFGHWR